MVLFLVTDTIDEKFFESFIFQASEAIGKIGWNHESYTSDTEIVFGLETN